MKKTIIVSFVFVLVITILDYSNIPTLLGLSVSNINWNFYIGILNVTAVIVVFAITFKTLSQREIKIHETEIKREKINTKFLYYYCWVAMRTAWIT